MEFALALAGILAGYLKNLHNKTAQGVGNVIDIADQATLAVLQENARIKGANVDWEDPLSVQAFIATIPTFTPIPEPDKKV